MTGRVFWLLGAVERLQERPDKRTGWLRVGAAAEQCCCLAASKESILWVAQERRDLGVGDISAVLGHPEGIRGRQELPARRGLEGDSPSFQRPTCQGFKEGNQIAAYDFALSMSWILRVCLIKGILRGQSVQSHFVVAG